MIVPHKKNWISSLDGCQSSKNAEARRGIILYNLPIFGARINDYRTTLSKWRKLGID